MNTTLYKSSKVRNAVRATLGAGIAVPLVFAAMPATAQSNDMQQLRQKVEQMQQKLSDMQESMVGDQAINMGETSVSFSGYFKLDAVYDFAGNQGATLLPTDIDDFGQAGYDEDANLGWTAKQTRLTISTKTPTAMGDIGGTLQMDMYANGFGFSDGGSPRIRLAYLTWNNWLIGRNWTNFSNFNYGTMLNFAGPTGQIFTRQEQVRYTFHYPAGGSLAIAVEDGQLDPGAVLGAADQNSSVPDLTLSYSGSAGLLDFDVAALARSISAESGTGEEDSVFGWGLTAGGSVSLPTGTTLMLQGTYGEGMGRYVYAPSFGTPAAYYDSSGDLQTVESFSAIASVSQEFTPKLTGNIVFGYGQSNAGFHQSVPVGGGATAIGFAPDEGDVSGTTLAVNMLYSPVDPLTFGIEYDRVSIDYNPDSGSGATGDANRVQFSTIYSF